MSTRPISAGSRAGQPASFSFAAFPGRTFTGSVKEIHRAPDVIQGVVTYTVVITAANPTQELLPGMTADVRITVDRRADVLRVPNAALRFRPEGGIPRRPALPMPPSSPADRASGVRGRRGQARARGGAPGCHRRQLHAGDRRRHRRRSRRSSSASCPRRSGTAASARSASEMATPVVALDRLRKIYLLGGQEIVALDESVARDRDRRARRRHGAVGLRQVDLHEPRRLPRPADLRQLSPRRGRRRPSRCRCPGDAPQPPHRILLPVLQPAAARDGAGQCRAAARLCRRCRRVSVASGRSEVLAAVGLGDRLPPSPDAAFGRPAAAGRDRPGARQPAVAHPRRRADRRARQPHRPRDHGPLRAPQRRAASPSSSSPTSPRSRLMRGV